jgi:hypothetical protein
MAGAQIFIYNAPAKLASNWFPENERVFATMAGTNTSILGNMLGFLFPRIYLVNYESSELYTEA